MKLLKRHEVRYIQSKKNHPNMTTEKLASVWFDSKLGFVESAIGPGEEKNNFLVKPKTKKAEKEWYYDYWIYWNESF